MHNIWICSEIKKAESWKNPDAIYSFFFCILEGIWRILQNRCKQDNVLTCKLYNQMMKNANKNNRKQSCKWQHWICQVRRFVQCKFESLKRTQLHTVLCRSGGVSQWKEWNMCRRTLRIMHVPILWSFVAANFVWA